MIKFPIGAGYVVPSYLVLVPMLLLLPPGRRAAADRRRARARDARAGRRCGAPSPSGCCSSIPDAWHTLGPALVLVAVRRCHGADGPRLARCYVAAFCAGCLFDLISATVREAAIHRRRLARAAPRDRARLDRSTRASRRSGLLVAHAARDTRAEVLLILPLFGVLLLLSRDRSARIAQAQRRLDLVAHERTRLQKAVRRLGDALRAPSSTSRR